MQDDKVTGSATTEALVSEILSDDVEGLSLHQLLSDKDVKAALVAEIRDAGVPAPGIVYRLIVFALGGCERFLGGSIKSRLQAYIDRHQQLAGIFQKLIELRHGEKTKDELKTSLLSVLNDGGKLDTGIQADEATPLEMVIALHTSKELGALDRSITALGDNLLSDFRDDLANQFNELIAPNLRWQNEVNNSDSLSAFDRIKYTSGIDQFIGREKETDLLHRFAGDPSFGGKIFNFRWMLMTGPGGEGKTRLAYHFTRNELSEHWYKGKLDFASLKAFDQPEKWRPRQPTFIVIDYAQSVPLEINRLLLAFSAEAENYEFPVRVLLLERSAEARWTDKMLPETNDKPVIEQHNFGGDSVRGTVILALAPTHIVNLMQHRIATAGLEAPVGHKLLKLALGVDPRRVPVEMRGQVVAAPSPRPLFALAVAEAIIEALKSGQEFPDSFEQESVLRGIIQRDRHTIWEKAVPNEGMRRRYEMGLAIVTLAQGISLSELSKVNFEGACEWLPPTPPNHDSIALAAFGYSGNHWPQMEPDILGEFFLSEQLSNCELSLEQRSALVGGAMSCGEDQSIISLIRLARDFPKRLVDLKLAEIAQVVSKDEALLSFGRLTIGLSSDCLDEETALQVFKSLFDRAAWKTSTRQSLDLAKSAYNIAKYAGQAGNWARVDDMLTALETLQTAFPEDREIALRMAHAAVNTSVYAGDADDWARVDDMLAKLERLRGAFPKDCEIAVALADLTSNILKHAGDAGDWARIDDMLARLHALLKEFPKDRSVALAVANSAINISKYAGAAGDWARADDILAWLDMLRNVYPEDSEVALTLAKTAVNISNYAGDVGDWARIDDILAKMDSLRGMFPKDHEIALTDSQIAFNITKYAAVAGDWTRVDDTLARLDALRKTFPRDHEIAQEEAKTTVNISIHAGASGDWTRIDNMLARMDALQGVFPEDHEIALTAAIIAFNISNDAGAADDWERVDHMLARLETLRDAFPEHREIALNQANAAVNISYFSRAASDWERVDDLLAMLETLRGAFPEDREIALVFAKTTFNLSKRAGNVGEWARVNDLLAKLNTLQITFPDSREIALEEAKALANALTVAGDAGDWARIDDMFTRLDVLREAFAEDREIALRVARAASGISFIAVEARDWTRVGKMLARLNELRGTFVEDHEIVLMEVKVVVGISTYAADAGDWTRLDDMLARINEILESVGSFTFSGPEGSQISLLELRDRVALWRELGAE
ncbi:hypothetical protein [Aliiroseovarius sp. F20344]|uniref:hypothetical protein n=1 Tax=Aliiroseovarius sp. F20344 TaxID=2926414 RepID=UPI001FF1CE18|nr:hypothetical protein [Aliiroseovarius sp. F20344]MCK0143145.1 hypothetical protein [Aliiroseovarius sp. F20344]